MFVETLNPSSFTHSVSHYSKGNSYMNFFSVHRQMMLYICTYTHDETLNKLKDLKEQDASIKCAKIKLQREIILLKPKVG